MIMETRGKVYLNKIGGKVKKSLFDKTEHKLKVKLVLNSLLPCMYLHRHVKT